MCFFSDDPNAYTVHPGRFAADTTATAIMYYGGPGGFVIGGFYHLGAYLYDNYEQLDKRAEKFIQSRKYQPESPSSRFSRFGEWAP